VVGRWWPCLPQITHLRESVHSFNFTFQDQFDKVEPWEYDLGLLEFTDFQRLRKIIISPEMCIGQQVRPQVMQVSLSNLLPRKDLASMLPVCTEAVSQLSDGTQAHNIPDYLNDLLTGFFQAKLGRLRAYERSRYSTPALSGTGPHDTLAVVPPLGRLLARSELGGIRSSRPRQ
jgi:hypothetical protein